MSILNKLTNETNNNEDLQDKGGAGFIGQSGVYSLTVNRAYLKEAKSGSIAIQVELKGEGMMEQTLWITTKDGSTKDKNGKALSSYVLAKKMNYLLTGENVVLGGLKTEEKLLKVKEWASEKVDGKSVKVEKEIKAEVLVDWIDKPIQVAVWMSQKEGSELVDGKYVNTGTVATNKDGIPYLEINILNTYDAEGRTAGEKMDDKEPKRITSDKEFLEKTPVRVFKAKGAKKANASTPSSNVVVPPKIF